MLTARLIESLKAELEPYRVPDMRASGLALRVSPSGLKTWDLAYRIKGSTKGKRLSLGRYGDPGAGLEEARARAGRLTAAARQGVDLVARELEASEAKALAMTIGQLVELYISRRINGRLRSASTVARILRRVLEPLSAMHAADVRRRDLSPLIERIAAQGRQRSAGYARQLIGTLFRWAETQDIVSVDPTKGLATFDLGTPRDRVLDADEIRALWPWLDSLPLAVADALRFQLLTGCRIGEVVGMTSVEIDREKWLWTLPGSRSKNKHPRVTPLVGMARTIIETRAIDGVLFPSETGNALTSASVGSALLNRRSRLPIAMFRSHDLRRSAATGMHELGIARDVIGAIVGHSSEGGAASRTLIRHYLKSDLILRKTRALEAWDGRLRAIISGELTENVVPLYA
jgi:integrase